MKSLSKLFMACGLIVGLAACNKELAPQQELPSQSIDKTFLSLNVTMPQTRSTTDETGYPSDAKPDNEVGNQNESAVGVLQLVLLDPANDQIIAVSKASETKKANEWNYVCPFNSADLINAAGTEERKLNVVAYVNQLYTTAASDRELTALVGQAFDPNQIYTAGDTPEEKLWAAGNFMMSNAEPAEMTLPTKNDLTTHYRDADNALNIGTVKVERLAARFDVAVEPENLNKTIGTNPFEVQFKEAGIFNLAKESYILRRVSADGLNPQDLNFKGLFGRELMNNYICDVYAADKNAYIENTAVTALPGDLKAKLFQYVEPQSYTDLASLKSEPNKDNWTPAAGQSYSGQEYYRWRYAVENVTPKSDKGNNQYQDITTGVCFKGTIVPTDQCPTAISEAMKTTPSHQPEAVYVYGDKLYGNRTTLWRAANGAPVDEQYEITDTVGHECWEINPSLLIAYNAVYNKLTEEQKKPENIDAAFLAKAKELANPTEEGVEPVKFKIFEAPYDIFYNYYNRHNANADNTITNPMEFAVVRNNVYKLRISKVFHFGDPAFRYPEKKPIEDPKAAFEVNVTVVPWTVRVNDIEF